MSARPPESGTVQKSRMRAVVDGRTRYGSAQRVQPDLACVERLLGRLHLRSVSRGLRIGEFLFEFRDRGVELARETLGTRLLLRVVLLPVLLIEAADRGLDASQAVFDRADLFARNA